MSGIYIHFPFCKQACHYCNFHFSTSPQFTASYLEALHKEIALRKDYLTDTVRTIYIGGGSPSLMSISALGSLLEALHSTYDIGEDIEVTLEANPDDLDTFHNNYLQELRATSVNRLSIGIQSFEEEDLNFMNRVHNRGQAISALKNSLDAGFENITADLIYGTPTLSDKAWCENLQRLIDLDIPHISAYALTVEEGTALDRFIKKGSVKDVDDHKVADQFEMMVEILESNGYEHYEISNFAKEGYRSKHNTNYWKGIPYLGLGPSAHSFNGEERQWNVAHTPKYIKGLENNQLNFGIEKLSIKSRYNEYVMTSLRTSWGVDLAYIHSAFGEEFVAHFQRNVAEYLDDKVIVQKECFTLNRKGKLYADRIASNLFAVE
ncbi:MAG: radical SAM family heme chaperone HemW [Flavobacteriales bacterium]|nr:radical SAM family heme chaperone HemW [Flavobacteriales bacterium]